MHDHLKLHPFNENMNSTAPHFASNTIVSKTPDPSATIHVRIADFGVCKWDTKASRPNKVRQHADIGLFLSILGRQPPNRSDSADISSSTGSVSWCTLGHPG